MKILVFSDSHGQLHHMERVLSAICNEMDTVLHLGDGYNDIAQAMQRYPDTPFKRVPGNCDAVELNMEYPSCVVHTIGGKKLLMTHGHLYGARQGVHKLSLLAEEKEADICLFGHTHNPCIITGDIFIMNPGSISRPRAREHPSYGVIEITPKGTVTGSIIEVLPNMFKIII